jgi:hypothetical protein
MVRPLYLEGSPWGQQRRSRQNRHFFIVGAPLIHAVAWCLRERSRRKTIKEVLPGLTQADPATIRAISRLLASSRWQVGQRSTPRPEIPPPPPTEVEPPSQAVS